MMKVISKEEIASVSGAGWAEWVIEHAQDIYDGLSAFADGVQEGYENSGAHQI